MWGLPVAQLRDPTLLHIRAIVAFKAKWAVTGQRAAPAQPLVRGGGLIERPAAKLVQGPRPTPIVLLTFAVWNGCLQRGAPAPPTPPFAPAYRPVIGSIIKVGGGSRPPRTPLFAPAYWPVIGSIIKVGRGGSRPSRTTLFAPAYRPVIGSIIKVGGADPRTPSLCTGLRPAADYPIAKNLT